MSLICSPGCSAGALAAWTNSWLAGHCGTSAVAEAVKHAGGPDTVADLPDAAPIAGLTDLLAAWRRLGSSVRLVLPVPGDLRGLPGPAEFRDAALIARAAVVGAGLSVVATEARWRVFQTEIAPRDHVQLNEAQFELKTAMREAAGALVAAEVQGASADIAEDLSAARRVGERLQLPTDHPSEAVALVAQAERLQAVLDIALRDPVGGAVDRSGIAARTEALRPLSEAVRRARLAGYNAGR